MPVVAAFVASGMLKLTGGRLRETLNIDPEVRVNEQVSASREAYHPVILAAEELEIVEESEKYI